MADTIRTFIAVKIPALGSLRSVIGKFATMGNAVKPLSVDNLHVTLKFLGDTSSDMVPEIVAILEDAARNETACELRIVGLGAFPTPRRPSVVWAGMENAETLVAIANHLESKLKRLGFKRERRAFQPHLTLARVKRKPPAELHTIIEQHEAAEFGIARINSVELMQSELRPDGPRYTALASVALAEQ